MATVCTILSKCDFVSFQLGQVSRGCTDASKAVIASDVNTVSLLVPAHFTRACSLMENWSLVREL
jgi:hypothetical protein